MHDKCATAQSNVQKEALAECARLCGYKVRDVVGDAFGAFEAARQRPTLFPEVLPLLHLLRARGKIIGALTNGNADARAVPGLDEVVDFCETAESAGAPKPARPIFVAAMRAAGVTDPRACVHVVRDFKMSMQVRRLSNKTRRATIMPKTL